MSQNKSEDALKEEFQIAENTLTSLPLINSQRPGYLRINDMEFDIPPKNIVIQNQEYSEELTPLRSSAPYIAKSGRKSLKVTIGLSVDVGKEGQSFTSGSAFSTQSRKALGLTDSSGRGWSLLSKLLIQVRKYPVVVLENEKIRTEVLSGFIDMMVGTEKLSNESFTDGNRNHIQNMAFIVEGIQGELDRQNPNLINIVLSLSFFNSFPYSLGFNFAKVTPAAMRGEELFIQKKTVAPTAAFREFYTANCLSKFSPTNLGPCQPDYEDILMNDPRDIPGRSLEIIYKEYDTIGSPRFIESYPDLSMKNFTEKTKASADKVSKNDAFHPDAFKVKQDLFRKTKAFADGWSLSTSGTINETTDIVVYRWVTETIEPKDGLAGSGDLFVQDAGFSYFNNIAYIPLQRYDIPTAQFMGGGRATVRLVLYAAPETKVTPQGVHIPVSTSLKLGRLQALLDQIKNNALKYPLYAKGDSLLVRHPFAKLLKYSDMGSNDPLRTFKDGKVVSIEAEDYLSCVVQNRASMTLEGSPYASSFQMDLIESKMVPVRRKNMVRVKKRDADKTEAEIDQVIEILLKDFYIELFDKPKKDEPYGKVFVSNYKKEKKAPVKGYIEYRQYNHSDRTREVDSPITPILREIEELVNEHTMYVHPFQNVSEIMKHETLIMEEEEVLAWTQKARKWFTTNGQSRDMRGYARAYGVDVSEFKEVDIPRNYFNGDPLTLNFLNRKAAQVLSLVNRNKNESWAKPYLELLEKILKRTTLDLDTLYPDMKLPSDYIRPLPHLYSENTLSNASLKYVKYLFKKLIPESEQAMGKCLRQLDPETDTLEELQKDNPELLGPDEDHDDVESMRITGNCERACNVNSPDDKDSIGAEQKRIMSHNNADPSDRAETTLEALVNMQGITRSLDQSLPICKVMLIDKSGRQELGEESVRGLLGFSGASFDIQDVMNVRIIKKEDNPVDVAVIKLVGVNSQKINTVDEDYTHEEIMARLTKKHNIAEATKASKRFLDRGIKEGTRIQIRMGYGSQFEDLPIEFNGRIASVTDGDIIEIIAAGDGAELIKELKHPVETDSFRWESNTYHLIRHLLVSSPEVQSFGTMSPTWKDFEITFLPAFVGGKTALDNIFAPNLFPHVFGKGGDLFDGVSKYAATTVGFAASFASRAYLYSSLTASVLDFAGKAGTKVAGSNAAKRGLLTKLARASLSAGLKTTSGRAGFRATALVARSALSTSVNVVSKFAGTNVGARILGRFAVIVGANTVPVAGQIASVGMALWTIVEVLGFAKELFGTSVLGCQYIIHKATIWDVLQEMTLRHPGTICSVVPYGDRSTLFFGDPHQYYFHRPLSLEEIGITGFSSDKGLGNTGAEKALAASGDSEIKGSDANFIGQIKYNEKARKTRQAAQLGARSIGNAQGEEKTPEQIRNLMSKVFRNYHYVSSISDIIKNNIQATSRGVYNEVKVSYPTSNDSGYFDGSEGVTDFKTTHFKADDDIDPGHLNVKHYTFPNAHNDTVKDLPYRYSKSLLVKNLEKIYQGKLILRGRPNVKPHDVVLLHDEYLDMKGPVGVREVVQIFDNQRGWITEITPKLMVFPEGSAGPEQLTHLKKMGLLMNMDDNVTFFNQLTLFYPGSNNDNFTFRTNKFSGAIAALTENYVSPDITREAQDKRAAAQAKENVGYEALETVLSGTSKVIAANSFVKALPGAIDTAVSGFKDLSTSATPAFKESFKVAGKFAKTKGVSSAVFSAAKGVGSVVISSGLKVALPVATLLLGNFIESKVEAFANYANYRQPVIYFPLNKNGAPFIAGLKGFKNNTIIESLTGDIDDAKDVLDYTSTALWNFYDRIMKEE